MPAEQKGSIYKTKGRGYGVRWLENGKRLQQSGFRSRTDARNYFRDEVRPRLDTASTTIDPGINLENFVKIYLTAHALNVETSTLAILKSRLNAATKTFGKVELRKLERKAPEIAAWRATLADGSRFGATQALRQCLEQANQLWSDPAQPCEARRQESAAQTSRGRPVHRRRARSSLRRARTTRAHRAIRSGHRDATE
jgi:hypothetical protein